MKIKILFFLAFSCMSVVRSSAQQQVYMLRSANPELAKNKKLVYDFWRIVFEGGHLDEAAMIWLPLFSVSSTLIQKIPVKNM